jgi:DNA-binding transcriptional MerR regulator/quercetin dioxygenase-like cupin family protein
MTSSPRSRRSGSRGRSTRVAAGTGRFGPLTVGQTARLVGVSPSTLRLWESVGLVAPMRSTGRYRMYSAELVRVLKRIKYLRDVRQLNVPGIKAALGGTARAPAGTKPTPNLGPKLRRLRQRRGLGIVEAARRAKISAGFLSAVERARANASVATLQRLAMAYGTTVIELFGRPRDPGRLVHARDRRVLQTQSGVRMELLSSGTTMLESMLFRVAPGAGSDGSYSHQGEEFIFMLQGTLEIWLDEFERHVLEAGDSFWFESMLAHRWFNPSDTETVLVWINTPPTF